MQRFENQFDNNSLPQRSLQSFVRMKNSYGTLVSLDRRIINEFPSNLIPNSSSLFFFHKFQSCFDFPSVMGRSLRFLAPETRVSGTRMHAFAHRHRREENEAMKPRIIGERGLIRR